MASILESFFLALSLIEGASSRKENTTLLYTSGYQRLGPGDRKSFGTWIPSNAQKVSYGWCFGELPAKKGDLREDWQCTKKVGDLDEWVSYWNPKELSVSGNGLASEDAGRVIRIDWWNTSDNRYRAFKIQATYASNGAQRAGAHQFDGTDYGGQRIEYQILLPNTAVVTDHRLYIRWLNSAHSPNTAWINAEDYPDSKVSFDGPVPEHDWMEERKTWNLYRASIVRPTPEFPNIPDSPWVEVLFLVTYKGLS